MARLPARPVAGVGIAGVGVGLPGVPQRNAPQDAGDGLLRLAAVERERADRTAANAAVTRARRAAIDAFDAPETGLRWMSGQQLFEETDKRSEQLQKAWERELNGLESDRQRALARPFFADIELSWHERVQAHEGNAREAFHLEAQDSYAQSVKDETASRIRLAAEAGDVIDQGYVIRQLQHLDLKDAEFAVANPQYLDKEPGEWMRERRIQRHTEVHAQVVETLLAEGRDEAALGYLEKFDDNAEEIDADVANRLNARVRDAAEIGNSLRAATQSFKDHQPTTVDGLWMGSEALAEGLASIDASGLTPEENKRARSELRRLFDASRQDFEAHQVEIVQELAAKFERDGDFSKIEMDARYKDVLSNKQRGVLKGLRAELTQAKIDARYTEIVSQLNSVDQSKRTAARNVNLEILAIEWGPDSAQFKDVAERVAKAKEDLAGFDASDDSLIKEMMPPGASGTGSSAVKKGNNFYRRASVMLKEMRSDPNRMPTHVERVEALAALAEDSFYNEDLADIEVPQEFVGLAVRSLMQAGAPDPFDPTAIREQYIKVRSGTPPAEIENRAAASDAVITEEELEDFRFLLPRYPGATFEELRRVRARMRGQAAPPKPREFIKVDPRYIDPIFRDSVEDFVGPPAPQSANSIPASVFDQLDNPFAEGGPQTFGVPGRDQ
jgi:hypothetical protein